MDETKRPTPDFFFDIDRINEVNANTVKMIRCQNKRDVIIPVEITLSIVPLLVL